MLLSLLAVLAFVLLCLPALFRGRDNLQFMRRFQGVWYNLLRDEFAVTITYIIPGSGTTVPGGALTEKFNLIVAQVAMGDAETQATLTHNWGLPASFPGFFFPIVQYVAQTPSGVNSFATGLTFSYLNTNAVIINKAALAAGGTFLVYLQRPSSFIR